MTPLELGDRCVVMTTVGAKATDHGPVKPDPTPIIEALVKALESNVEDARQEAVTLADSPSDEDREIGASAQATVEAGSAAIQRAKAWLEEGK